MNYQRTRALIGRINALTRRSPITPPSGGESPPPAAVGGLPPRSRAMFRRTKSDNSTHLCDISAHF